jgi:sortase (surface protein transpeptidase)
MKKLLLYGGLIALIVIAVVAFNLASHTPTPANISADGIPSQPWQPSRLQIPAIHIDAPIIFVGKTASGVMNAPVSKAVNSPYWTSVFWFDPGAAPGQSGNAVIAGHVDRVGGDPAIFWYLKDLAPGDTLSIVTLGGSTLHFVVNRLVSYPANAPGSQVINAVFGPISGHHLNLITCNGVWTGHGYDQRLVVFTTQVS